MEIELISGYIVEIMEMIDVKSEMFHNLRNHITYKPLPSNILKFGFNGTNICSKGFLSYGLFNYINASTLMLNSQ